MRRRPDRAGPKHCSGIEVANAQSRSTVDREGRRVKGAIEPEGDERGRGRVVRIRGNACPRGIPVAEPTKYVVDLARRIDRGGLEPEEPVADAIIAAFS